MHTGKQKQMNASYQTSLVNRHIRRFTGVYGQMICHRFLSEVTSNLSDAITVMSVIQLVK